MSDKNNVRVVRKSFYSTFRMHFATVIEREKKERKNELRSWIWSSRIIQSCRIWGVGGSVVSKYTLDRVLTREFLHFDTRTRSYSSSFHKTSNEWGEF